MQGLRSGAVAAAHHVHLPVPEEEPVAGGAIAHAPAPEAGLPRDIQRFRLRAGGQDQGFGPVGIRICPQNSFFRQNLPDGGTLHHCPGAFRLLHHGLHQACAIDSGQTRVIIDPPRQCRLPAGDAVFQNQRPLPRPGRIKPRRQSGAPGPQNNNIPTLHTVSSFFNYALGIVPIQQVP